MRFFRVTTTVLALMIVGMDGRSAELIHESGNFIAEVERLTNLAFPKDSGLYVPPTSEQQAAFASMADSLSAGQVETVVAMAPSLGYEVVQFTDTNSSVVLYGLREVLHGGVQSNGWGTYYVNRNCEVSDLIEVPHLLYDSNTWSVGAQIFLDSRAAGFLLAGADRNANGYGTADVTRLTNTIFHAVHKTWNGEHAENVGWQIHGFDYDLHTNFPPGSDAILSNGDGGISPEIIYLDQCFQTNGFLSYAYNTLASNNPTNVLVNDGISGTTFGSLSGTINVQGIYSRSIGGKFVHIELEQSIRFDSANQTSAVALISNGIRMSSRIPPQIAEVRLSSPSSATFRLEHMLRGRGYQVQWCTNLTMGAWSTGTTFSATSNSTNLPVTISEEWNNAFFRILLRQPEY